MKTVVKCSHSSGVAALEVKGKADFHRSQTWADNDNLRLETSPGMSEKMLACRCLLRGTGCA